MGDAIEKNCLGIHDDAILLFRTEEVVVVHDGAFVVVRFPVFFCVEVGESFRLLSRDVEHFGYEAGVSLEGGLAVLCVGVSCG